MCICHLNAYTHTLKFCQRNPMHINHESSSLDFLLPIDLRIFNDSQVYWDCGSWKIIKFSLYSIWVKAACLLISQQQKTWGGEISISDRTPNGMCMRTRTRTRIFIIILTLLLCHLLSKLTTMTNLRNNQISVTQNKINKGIAICCLERCMQERKISVRIWSPTLNCTKLHCNSGCIILFCFHMCAIYTHIKMKLTGENLQKKNIK